MKYSRRDAEAQRKVPMVRLGDYIEELDERNEHLEVSLSQGINNEKDFQTPKQVAENSRADKIVRIGTFAYNRATTRNGEKISISYREGSDCTVSGAYGMFRVKDENVLDSKFLWMFFRRAEFDRYARSRSWGSAHEFFTFSDMCDVHIPLPSIDVQRKVVAAWEGLRKLQQDNEALAAALKKVCSAKLVEIKAKWPKKQIGPYIRDCVVKNSDNAVKEVRSVSVTKEFRETNAKVDKNDLRNYLIVNPGQMAFVQTTGNEKCLACAYNNFDYPVVVSSVDKVIESIDEKVLCLNYLYLFFNTKEFDRYARYNSWGSAREVFTYDDMCRVQIPLPPRKVQESVVALYACADRARTIAMSAKEQLAKITPSLIRYAAEGGAM